MRSQLIITIASCVVAGTFFRVVVNNMRGSETSKPVYVWQDDEEDDDD